MTLSEVKERGESLSAFTKHPRSRDFAVAIEIQTDKNKSELTAYNDRQTTEARTAIDLLAALHYQGALGTCEFSLQGMGHTESLEWLGFVPKQKLSAPSNMPIG